MCGLIAGALAAIGLDVYDLFTNLESGFGIIGARSGRIEAQTLASGLDGILFDAGTLLGFAGIVFVLATRRRGATNSSSS